MKTGNENSVWGQTVKSEADAMHGILTRGDVSALVYKRVRLCDPDIAQKRNTNLHDV